MCNNNHWNLAQIVPDCQLKMRPVRGGWGKLKAVRDKRRGGGEKVLKSIKLRQCLWQGLPTVWWAFRDCSLRRGTEVDWEKGSCFYRKLKAKEWGAKSRKYVKSTIQKERKKQLKCVVMCWSRPSPDKSTDADITVTTVVLPIIVLLKKRFVYNLKKGKAV